MTAAELEQTKHMASWMNSLATALATAGAIVPLVAYVTDTLPGTARVEAVWGAGTICFTLSLTLHLIGREILSEI
jgi:uncharacterized membrane protein